MLASDACHGCGQCLPACPSEALVSAEVHALVAKQAKGQPLRLGCHRVTEVDENDLTRLHCFRALGPGPDLLAWLAASTPDAPLRYVHGTGQMLPALEAVLEGRRAGDELSVTLTPEQAYGPHRPELVFEAVRDNLPPGQEIRVGMTLTPGGQRGRFSLNVVGLTERGAMLDGNHPLAGRTVTWEIWIQEVQPSKQPPQGDLDYPPIRWVSLDE